MFINKPLRLLCDKCAVVRKNGKVVLIHRDGSSARHGR